MMEEPGTDWWLRVRDPEKLAEGGEGTRSDGMLRTAILIKYLAEHGVFVEKTAPPGIPLLIPGERFNETIVRYLKFTRDFNKKLPGFETDVHGLVKDKANSHTRYFVDFFLPSKGSVGCGRIKRRHHNRLQVAGCVIHGITNPPAP